MKAEGVTNGEFTRQVADQKGLILHGKATRAGRIVSALVDADQEVTEFNIRQISERLDGYRTQGNHQPQLLRYSPTLPATVSHLNGSSSSMFPNWLGS